MESTWSETDFSQAWHTHHAVWTQLFQSGMTSVLCVHSIFSNRLSQAWRPHHAVGTQLFQSGMTSVLCVHSIVSNRLSQAWRPHHAVWTQPLKPNVCYTATSHHIWMQLLQQDSSQAWYLDHAVWTDPPRSGMTSRNVSEATLGRRHTHHAVLTPLLQTSMTSHCTVWTQQQSPGRCENHTIRNM